MARQIIYVLAEVTPHPLTKDPTDVCSEFLAAAGSLDDAMEKARQIRDTKRLKEPRASLIWSRAEEAAVWDSARAKTWYRIARVAMDLFVDDTVSELMPDTLPALRTAAEWWGKAHGPVLELPEGERRTWETMQSELAAVQAILSPAAPEARDS